MKSYFLRIRKYIWIVVASTLLTIIIGYLVLRAVPAVVQASSIIYVSAGTPGNPYSPSLSTTDSLGLATDYASVIPTRTVMQYVFNSDPEINKRRFTVDDLQADVTAIASATTATVTITASATHVNDAVLLANDVANGFSAYIQAQRQQDLNTTRQNLQNQLTADQKQRDALTADILRINNPSDPNVAIDTADRNAIIQVMNSLQAQLVLLPPTASSGIVLAQQAVPQNATPAIKTSLVLAISAGLGLVIGFLIMLLVIFLDNRVYSEEQVKEKVGLAYLGGLPKDSAIKENPARPTGEVVRNLADICANLRLTGVLPEQWKAPQGVVLLITSSQVVEGKTTLATALAATMAGGGTTVVVIDGNLRQPSTHLAFGMGAGGIGLNGLLKGTGGIDDAVLRSKIPGVWLLPGGSSMSDATFLLRQRLPEILTQLRKRADLVIIDGPALLSGAEGIELATMADGVALVVDASRERLPLLLRAKDLLNSLAHVPVGIILNHLARRRRNQYYATAYPGIAVVEKGASVQAHTSNGNGHQVVPAIASTILAAPSLVRTSSSAPSGMSSPPTPSEVSTVPAPNAMSVPVSPSMTSPASSNRPSPIAPGMLTMQQSPPSPRPAPRRVDMIPPSPSRPGMGE